MTTTDRFQGWTCHAPEERIERMTAVVMQAVERKTISRVLDLGCGTGGQTRRLAELLPAATLVGVDISAANIAAADAARERHPAASRLSFIAANYFVLQQPAFDLIVSDGVLHLVDEDNARVAHKLAADLVPGGTLVVAMASHCLYNRVFSVIRRGLRGVRSRPIDRAILAVGQLLYGREMSTAMLAERVHYMYLPPTRLMGPRFRAALAAAGLTLVATHPMKSTSVSQLTHAAFVFRRGDRTA